MQRKQNMAESQDNSWRTQSFRQNVRGKIEEAIRQSGNPTTKSVAEMENHVFQKAKTKEEYLGFVARLIIHVREMIDEDSDSDSSSSDSDSEIETYVDDDTVDDSEEDEIEDCEYANGVATKTDAQKKQESQQSSEISRSSQGTKRKRTDMENSSPSAAVHRLPLEKCNTEINEWEAVGVNVYRKLQRMDPHQALYAESLITKVLRLGLLQALTPDIDICRRPQYSQDVVPPGGSSQSLNLNHSIAPVFETTQLTSSSIVPLSSLLPVTSAYTSESSTFQAEQCPVVVDQISSQNNISTATPSTIKFVGADQNSIQNICTEISGAEMAFKIGTVEDGSMS